MSDYYIDQSSLNLGEIPQMEGPDNDYQSLDIDFNRDSIIQNKQTPLSAPSCQTTIQQIIVKAASKRNKSKDKTKLNRKISKSKKGKKISSYKKNICGYITKKVLRQFTSGGYRKKIEEMCYAQNADFQATKNYYQAKIQGITGPSHIPILLSSRNNSQIPGIRVFIKFFKWFLTERYVRHLFLQGKMEMKSVYIEYKNKQLMPLIASFEKNLMEEAEAQYIQNSMGELDVLL